MGVGSSRGLLLLSMFRVGLKSRRRRRLGETSCSWLPTQPAQSRQVTGLGENPIVCVLVLHTGSRQMASSERGSANCYSFVNPAKSLRYKKGRREAG